MRRPLFVLLLLLAAGTLAAQPMYHNYEQMTAVLESVVSSRSGIASMESIAKTRQGRDVWLIRIGTGDRDQKPAVLVVGGVEGSDVAGSEMTMRFALELISDRTDSASRLLDRVTYYVIPRLNPDAAESMFSSLHYERHVNTTPSDFDNDGEMGEDGFDDLNGDGLITLMRVRAPGGRYITDPDDSLMLRPADAANGERGVWQVYDEGLDNDGDGRFNEDPQGGVNVNRNFTYNYPYFQPGAGEHQVSEAETRAVADFAYDHQNIAAVFAFAPQNTLSHPPKARPGGGGDHGASPVVTSVRKGDEELMGRIAGLYEEITGTKDAPEYSDAGGSLLEWAYYHYGRPAFGTLGWWMPSPMESSTPAGGDTAAADQTNQRRGRAANSEKGSKPTTADTLRWLESHGVADAWIPWSRVEHPDFPNATVEVGGFAPFVRTNPPAGMLDSTAHKHTMFLKALGWLLPRIERADVKTENLGGGVRRITLTVVNTGLLPTLTEMGEMSRVPIDVKAEVQLAGNQQLIAGNRVQLLGPIAGNGGTRELTWLVAGPGTVKINVWGPMAAGFLEVITN